MMKFFAVLAVLAIAGVALGFYRGWFDTKTKSESTGTEVTLNVDHEKFKKDTEVTLNVDHEKFKKDKEQYKTKAEDRLKDLDGQMEKLNAKAKVASGDAKIQMDKDLEVLKHKKEAAGKKLGEIEEASAEKWEVVKANIETDFDDLKKGFENFVARHK